MKIDDHGEVVMIRAKDRTMVPFARKCRYHPVGHGLLYKCPRYSKKTLKEIEDIETKMYGEIRRRTVRNVNIGDNY